MKIRHGNPQEECFSWSKAHEEAHEENIPRDCFFLLLVVTHFEYYMEVAYLTGDIVITTGTDLENNFGGIIN